MTNPHIPLQSGAPDFVTLRFCMLKDNKKKPVWWAFGGLFWNLEHTDLNVFQYSDNSGGQGGHSKPAPAPKQAVRKAPKPTPPATTAAPKPLGPPVYIDDNYGSTNYDDYETDYDQEYVDIEADLDYESSDYDDQNNQQGETYFTTYCTIALLTYLH